MEFLCVMHCMPLDFSCRSGGFFMRHALDASRFVMPFGKIVSLRKAEILDVRRTHGDFRRRLVRGDARLRRALRQDLNLM
jgi:hypothetical protein